MLKMSNYGRSTLSRVEFTWTRKVPTILGYDKEVRTFRCQAQDLNDAFRQFDEQVIPVLREENRWTFDISELFEMEDSELHQEWLEYLKTKSIMEDMKQRAEKYVEERIQKAREKMIADKIKADIRRAVERYIEPPTIEECFQGLYHNQVPPEPIGKVTSVRVSKGRDRLDIDVEVTLSGVAKYITIDLKNVTSEMMGELHKEMKIAEYDTINKIVEQLELCGYSDEIGHPIENNIAFIALKRMMEDED